MSYDDRDRVIAWLEAGNGKGLTPLDRGVLIFVAHHANSETDESWKGDAFLAAVWGVHVKSIERSIRRLHDAKLITTKTKAAWGKRARYALIGEPTGYPIDNVGEPTGYRVGEPTGYPDTESSRSDDDDSGVETHSGVSNLRQETVEAVRERLGDRASDQIAKWFARAKSPISDPDAFITKCLANYRPRKTKQRPASIEGTAGEIPKAGVSCEYDGCKRTAEWTYLDGETVNYCSPDANRLYLDHKLPLGHWQSLSTTQTRLFDRYDTKAASHGGQ